ncbi:MAG TPA: C4-type zinc ribbon domain-containing protein [Acidobacteriota bacterium]|nr:C4-type zinc ribbon domain-containing protein [Acidobacteriota bacterium]
MNPELRNLIALQDTETKITVLQKQVADIPNKIQKFENDLERLRATHRQSVESLKEIAGQRRVLEGEVEMMRSKLVRLRDQLMTVKTNKEYTAMTSEIKTAEESIRRQEDRILEVMETTENREQDLRTAEKEWQKQSAEINENIRKTKESLPLLESELARSREEKASMELRISAALLDDYRRIAGAYRGIALAEAKEELCGVCHVRIRPQMYANLLHTDEIQFCDSCSRILFSREYL